MRALYEINADLEALLSNVDPETGELLIDPEALDALMMERRDKLEGVALSCKNDAAEIAAIQAEENNLAARRKAIEKRRDGKMEWLRINLNGEVLDTPRVVTKYTRSKAADIQDEDAFWAFAEEYPAYVRRKEPEPNKAEIRKALLNGLKIPGAALVENVSMTIK